ncbi:Pyridoxal phosphate-dependent transferase [Trinorchestia longiramus]|nr:Pyridoxal phosphate-dependent transferase [Trinorchestia longiramus]
MLRVWSHFHWRKLAECFMAEDLDVVTKGTDNHLVWLDLRRQKLLGAKAEKILEEVSIAVNKNTVSGDKSALSPGGLRFGSPALTTRGLKEEDFATIVKFIMEALQVAKDVQTASGPALAAWNKVLQEDVHQTKVADIRARVEKFAESFPMPGLATF